MKKLNLLIAFVITLINAGIVNAQDEFNGFYRTPSTNSNYHQFIRKGVGAAVYINQVDNTNPILKLSSGTSEPNKNVKFTVENSGRVIADGDISSKRYTIDNGTDGILMSKNPYGTHCMIGTFPGWEKSAIYIAGYNNFNNTDYATKKVYIGKDMFFNLESNYLYTRGIRLGGWASPDPNYYSNGSYVVFSDPGKSEDFIGYKNNTFYFMDCLGGADTKDPNVVIGGTLKCEEIKVELIAANTTNISGTLSADKITVNANGNTADFVFADDYNLRELSEVENYITTNKHLPDVPCAATMEEEGVNLAEMNKLLLQKVEELMLYTIAQEKKLGSQAEMLDKQQNQINQLLNK